MILNQITPLVGIKNLRRRPDRLEHIQREMAKINTQYKIFDVVDDRGTLKSAVWWNAHNFLHIIRYAKAANLESILLLDDDCFFVNDFNSRLESLWPHVPADWDMVSFGEIFGRQVQVHPGIVRSDYSWGGHASLIRNTTYDRLLECTTGETWADEEWNMKLKPNINFYVFLPYLITQMPGHSDLKGHHVENNLFE